MKKHIKYIIYFAVAFIMILLLSKSTSPIYGKVYSIDSSIFQIMGKGIVKGYIPYVDLFDHKGPILFFIQAFGYVLNKNWGIFILQIVNLYITIIFLDKLIRLFKEDKKKQIFSLIMTLIFYALLFGEGNLSEEWSMSFITISLYIICKGLFIKKFNKIDYFINGVNFAIISLIRINNAATIIGFCIYQFFNLIIHKEYKELIKFIVYFFIGIIVIYIPILIIFYKWNAIYEMIYATFLFNFIYSTNKETFSLYLLIRKICAIIPLFFLYGIIRKSEHSKSFKRFILSVIIMNCLSVSIAYGYLHYYIIIVPLMALLPLSWKETEVTIIKVMALNMGLSCWISFYVLSIEESKADSTQRIVRYEDVAEFKQYIDDENSVLCYNCPASIYLTLDIMPAYKYFAFQGWHSINNLKVQNEDFNAIEDKQIKYIITRINDEESFLSSYSPICQTEKFILYELQQDSI